MSVTDELRRLLDARGEEHHDELNFVKWNDANQHPCFAFETYERPGLLRVHCNLTPEQAVEATLGRAYEPPVAARWDGDVLILTIPRDPSSICVQRSESQPRKVYAEETKVIAAALGGQPPYGELIEALRRDWHIEASWDGLRRFWYIGLTEEGMRKRDEREATLERGTLGHAYVDITPRVDWARMADELDVFSQLVRGFAEQVGESEGDRC